MWCGVVCGYNGIGLLRRCDSGLVTTEESRSHWAGAASTSRRQTRQETRTHIALFHINLTNNIITNLTNRTNLSPPRLFLFPFVLPTAPGDQLLSGAAHRSIFALEVQHFLRDSNILTTSDQHQHLRPEASGSDLPSILSTGHFWTSQRCIFLENE